MDKRKSDLIEALKKEMESLPEVNAFGESNNFKEYDLVISYLETGKYIEGDCDTHDLLYDAVYDIDVLYADYEV